MPKKKVVLAMKISIASGKGGTGKTFISTNLAYTFAKKGKGVAYLDCDVEEPNGHLFLQPEAIQTEEIKIKAPLKVDNEKCTGCRKCADACTYNAIAVVNNKAMIFSDLCHVCGACSIVCPEGAIVEGERKIGDILHGHHGGIELHYGLLYRGEGGMSPQLIQRVKEHARQEANILDAPPGTACSAVESISDSDLVVLVADPTPFGVNDLRLSVDMCRTLGIEPVIVVNRAEYRDGNLKKYCEEAELDIITEIPDDRKIAELYSDGRLAAAELPRYRELFEELAGKLEHLSGEGRSVRKRVEPEFTDQKKLEKALNSRPEDGGNRPAELVVISGKGGTGKTSVVASFAALARDTVISDCDVDAADLHLILQPELKESGYFSGGYEAKISQEKCTQCGRCYQECRFDAIRKTEEGGKTKYAIDPFACEGCGVCNLVCPAAAVDIKDAINGEWYISETRFGHMTHAKLGMAEENSGRLVSLTRDKQALVAAKNNLKKAIVDGSPGTGCPVIASLTGAQYALIVTEPTVSGVHDLERILDVTEYFNIKAGVVVNKADINFRMAERIREKVQKIDNTSYLGEIPYDSRVTEAQMQQQSIVEYAPNSEVSKRIRELFERVYSEL